MSTYSTQASLPSVIEKYESKNILPVWVYFSYAFCALFFVIGVAGLIYTLMQKSPADSSCNAPGQILDPVSQNCYYKGDPGKITLKLPEGITMDNNLVYNKQISGSTWCSPTYYRLYAVDNQSLSRSPWFPDEKYNGPKVSDEHGNYFYGPVQITKATGCYDKSGQPLNYANIIVAGLDQFAETNNKSVNVFMYTPDKTGNVDLSSEMMIGNLFPNNTTVVPNTMANPISSGTCCSAKTTTK